MQKYHQTWAALGFIGNTITGMEENDVLCGNSRHARQEMYLKEGAGIGLPNHRFIARGNLVENFMDGISLLDFREINWLEINGQNVIQNNENGVYVYGPFFRKTFRPTAN
jgi:hypothetical protein